MSEVALPVTNETTPSSSSITYDEVTLEKLAERITFFFSDSNFRTDKFMLNESRNNDGYIEITSLLKFNSIKKISNSMEHIAQAARQHVSDKVVVSKDGEAIRRKFPLPVDEDGGNVKRTIYVDGIPMENVSSGNSEGEKEELKKENESSEADEGETDTTTPTKPKTHKRFTVGVSEVTDVFKKYGKVNLVRFRFSKSDKSKGLTKSALGSCFVEFDSSDSVEKVVADVADEKVDFLLTLGEKKLKPVCLQDWLDKCKEKRDKKNEKENEKKASSSASTEGTTTEDKTESATEEPLVIEDIVWEKNTVITLTGLPETCDRETLKAAFEEAGKECDYVDYSRGQTTGAVRFGTSVEDLAEVAEKFNSGAVKISEVTVEAKALTGEEEENYWAEASKAKAERMKNRKRNGDDRDGGNKRRKFGGRGGGRGGRR